MHRHGDIGANLPAQEQLSHMIQIGLRIVLWFHCITHYFPFATTRAPLSTALKEIYIPPSKAPTTLRPPLLLNLLNPLDHLLIPKLHILSRVPNQKMIPPNRRYNRSRMPQRMRIDRIQHRREVQQL